MTHGDEPAGLAAVEYVIEHILPNKRLLRGSIFLVLNNARAAERYFGAESEEEARQTRFVNTNMNRLARAALEEASSVTYEVVRVKELEDIYEQFDVGIDIHSTAQESEPMIIVLGTEFPSAIVNGIPIQNVITNIDRVQIGKPVSHLYGRRKNDAIRVGIEAGSHENPETFRTAVATVKAVLGNLGMFAVDPDLDSQVYEEYEVFDSVRFPDESYSLTRLFEDH
mgnify:FL=1